MTVEEIEALRTEPEFRAEVLAATVRTLVRCSSVNPGTYERDLASLIGSMLDDVCTVDFVESLPDRHSVVALLEGPRRGPRLVLNGHMDTVPVDDPGAWTVDPFAGVERDGYIYGRGSCDMKAGLAAQIAVARHLAKLRDRLQGSLVLHFAIGEERGEPGTESLLEAGYVGDVGIVTEPTELKVATAARGRAYFKIRIKGRSVHASRAREGVNPILRLGAVIDVIRHYERAVETRRHPLLPGGTCTPTVIRAGIVNNAVPDSCDVLVDRRLLPGEIASEEMEVLRKRLGAIERTDSDFRFEIETSPDHFEAAETCPDSSFVRLVRHVVERVTGDDHAAVGVPYSCDFSRLVNDAGMEAVVCGPGDVAKCHCADERVAVSQVQDAALVLACVSRAMLLPA